MNKKYFILVLSLLPFLALADTYLEKKVFVGDIIEIKSKNRVWIENQDLFKILSKDRGLRLRARKEGQSYINSDNKKILITISSSKSISCEKKLISELKKTVGLSYHLENSQLMITGKLFRWKDWERLFYFSKNNSCSYKMSVSLNANSEKLLQVSLKNFLGLHGVSRIKYINSQTRWFVSLSSKSSEIQKSVFKNLGFEIDLHSEQIRLTPLVRVSIKLVEIHTSKLSKVGIGWPTALSWEVIPKAFGDFEKTSSVINALENQGFAQTIANPQLLSRSGEEAEFFAGGEIPIKISNYRQKDIVWKKYGVILKLKSVADELGYLSSSVTAELSSLDRSQSIENIPAIKVHRVQSSFNSMNDTTIVLSGLMQDDFSRSKEGISFLSQIPILGSLFRSEDFQNKKSELFIFVSPKVITEQEQINDIHFRK
jgi:pilus assembly protein CpaC